MTEKKDNEETDKIVNEVISQNILRHTIQFFIKGEKRLEPFASGVFVKIYNDYFIFTASHVADYFEKYEEKNLHIRVGEKSYINVIGDIKYTDIQKSKGIDLAYIKLDNQMVDPLLKPYIPLTIDKIRSHHNPFNAMNYCVLGYPEKNVSKESEPLETGASYYLTSASKEKVYDYYKYDKKDNFIVEIQGKGTDIKTNEIKKINIEFYGISGCGLWLLNYYNNPDNGKLIVDYRLIGIMTEFKKGKYFCLIANKVYSVIEALKVIEKYVFIEKKIVYK
ncbi:MAG: hypothetical protein KA210_03375 [Bacteroidia bacterium]|nr:hypothetical protein [Bacteroidia bacterium]